MFICYALIISVFYYILFIKITTVIYFLCYKGILQTLIWHGQSPRSGAIICVFQSRWHNRLRHRVVLRQTASTYNFSLLSVVKVLYTQQHHKGLYLCCVVVSQMKLFVCGFASMCLVLEFCTVYSAIDFDKRWQLRQSTVWSLLHCMLVLVYALLYLTRVVGTYLIGQHGQHGRFWE